MEDKTLADWESEKKIMNSEEIRSKPTMSRLTLEEPAGYEEVAEPGEEAEEVETRTDQDPEPDSDEEEILESVAESQGRRYPLRERKAPRRFPDAELRESRKASKKLRRTPTAENG